MRLLNCIKNIIKEERIGKLFGNIKVKVSIETSSHGNTQRFRHGKDEVITNEEILKYEQNRVEFNKYYNDAVLDVLVLKHAGNTIKEIQNLTPYDINFIVHVIK